MGKHPVELTAYFPACSETYFYHCFREVVRERKWNLYSESWSIYKESVGAEGSLLYFTWKHVLDFDTQIFKAP